MNSINVVITDAIKAVLSIYSQGYLAGIEAGLFDGEQFTTNVQLGEHEFHIIFEDRGGYVSEHLWETKMYVEAYLLKDGITSIDSVTLDV